MPHFQILCEPDGKTARALSVPPEDEYAPLVIAMPNQTDDHQLWRLEPFADVDDHDNAVLAFFLINKKTGMVAQAPHDTYNAVRPNTQGVTQAYRDGPGIISPIRLWTLAPSKAGFAVRPLGDVHQNLNAWDKKIEPGRRVGIYQWKDGEKNEVWGFKEVG